MTKIKDVLAEMTDSEIRTWLQEWAEEQYASYSRDEMLAELSRIADEGAGKGYKDMSYDELKAEVLSTFDPEFYEDAEEENDVAQGMLVWVAEMRTNGGAK